jgi:hypothetical protein
MTTQVYAAEGERILSTQIDSNFPRPYDWVDEATGGGAGVIHGQQIADGTNIWVTEFFNRSIRHMWSLDGSAKNVGGPILTPDLDATAGTLTPAPDTEYALALDGTELAAPVVDRRKGATLYRLDGRPMRLAASVTGLYGDGWMADEASYTRYDVSRDGPGLAFVKLKRENWCPHDVPGNATIRIGPVAIGPDRQPTIREVTQVKRGVLHACEDDGFVLSTPAEPWRIEITIDPTFVPNELDPSRSDRRELGAQVEVGFRPLFDPSP